MRLAKGFGKIHPWSRLQKSPCSPDAQRRDRRSPVGQVVELQHVAVLPQHRLDDLPLDADSPAVDDPDLSKSFSNGLIEVFLDDGLDLAGLERVEVDRVLDGEVVGRFGHREHFNSRSGGCDRIDGLR